MTDDFLSLPPDLQFLIEKRSRPDRRKKERRTADLGPIGSTESAASPDEIVLHERRSGSRRKKGRGGRRKTDRA
jgi:hypothetical protein